eukprot:2200133-Prymnesium_polylepis.1
MIQGRPCWMMRASASCLAGGAARRARRVGWTPMPAGAPRAREPRPPCGPTPPPPAAPQRTC